MFNDDGDWLTWQCKFMSTSPPSADLIERFKEKVGGHESDGVDISDARIMVFNEMYLRTGA